MKNYVKGQYRKAIYESDKGYVIGIFKVKETNVSELDDYVGRTITFTGTFGMIHEGDPFTFYGDWVSHPKYGNQFQVTSYEQLKPEEKDGLILFLSSSLFPGIGEKQATQIIDTLGETVLDQISANKSCLELVPDLSSKKIEMIYRNLLDYNESHKTIVYLTNLGFRMEDALRIYEVYQGNTITNLEHNIYSVMDDIDHLSFPVIDKLASKYGIEVEDERRVVACIYYMMKKLIFEKSSTYLEYEETKEAVQQYLQVYLEDAVFHSYLKELEINLKIVNMQEKYYLFEMYEAEEFIIGKLGYLVRKEDSSIRNLETQIKRLEEELSLSYNDTQKRAILDALRKNVVIITGGPGTGKTTIIKAIVELYKRIYKLSDLQLESNISLLAPTGRASKRLSEATSFGATTIHRFLKWNRETDQYTVNEYNRDQSKLIIVDEVSMLDEMLFYHLLKGTLDDIKLVLVGDYDQLPSVGPGQLLKDLIESSVIPTVQLNLLYRQDKDSYIPYLAEQVKNDSLNESLLETHSDFKFLQCSSEVIVDSLKNIAIKFVEKQYDYRQFQMMAPMYKGMNGIDNLNKELQTIFNPKSPLKNEVVSGDVVYRVGDKVLQLVNIPDDNVFNGDIGIIKEISEKLGKKEMMIDFDGNEIIYTPKDFINIKHAFITSIHKSQGNEFDIVVMPVSFTYRRMLYRKLLYTGITRAKKKLFLVGEVSAFQSGISSMQEMNRKTDLKERLMYKFN